jgi:hypothetical protein
MLHRQSRSLIWLKLCLVAGTALAIRGKVVAQSPAVDFARYSSACGVEVRHDAGRLRVAWRMNDAEFGRVTLNLTPGQPLIETLGVATRASGATAPLLQNVEPVTFLTVGERRAPTGRPPTMSVFNVFFDKPASRPHETFLAKLDLQRVRVTSQGRRATVALDEVTAGTFKGDLRFTFYDRSRLLHVETVLATEAENRAILYDAGLVSENAGWQRVAWMDTEGQLQRASVDPSATSTALAVRHRALMAETANGAVACFPPPHQFHFPRDWTDNLKFTWQGRTHHGQPVPFGLGVRQEPDGKRAFEPWFNAPPGTQQRLGVFYLLTRGRAEDALEETLRYTRGDRFPKLPGHITFTSHYHMAVAVEAMKRGFKGTPEFVRMFNDMGVDAVHLGDFHGDGHPKDPGPLRLPELEALFKECRRLSDDELLLIPGEEINEFLGLPEPGKHPGHWMSLFPKPVYWLQKRAPEEPFLDQQTSFPNVYRVGSREDMIELIRRERALVWSAHPRIKASSWCPDIFRHEDFYLADFWLGGAWKAMPADLSRERLGERVLDLLDDMANWGQRKYVLGEVDVFKLDHTHELFGHMNINYVRLDRLPRFDDGWAPILAALRAGQFFVTTGEILIRDFTVGGRHSGEILALSADRKPDVRASLAWTFPLRFAEVISGDGEKVFRERLDLADTIPFGRRTVSLQPDLRGRKWVRFEVWDIAANGAFTQPVWLE